MLTPQEKRELLGIARDAIRQALVGHSPRAGDHDQRHVRSLTGHLAEQRGVFVTLREHHRLRGCIGYVESAHPLGEAVAEVAVKAALDDPRFPPLSREELRELELEISVLSPPRRITSPEEIDVGVHGLLLESGDRRGLLLPQVAVEYGWDRETFVDAVVKKAGVSWFSWNDPDARMYVFTAEIFQEPFGQG